jgi:hypothetical protein
MQEILIDYRLSTGLRPKWALQVDMGNSGWKLLMVGEQHFRRLKGTEWLPAVACGTRFVDGKLAEEPVAEKGAT